MSDFKKAAAKEAISFIKNYKLIGLGDGSSIIYIVEFLKQHQHDDLFLYTSSNTTKKALEDHDFTVHDFSTIHSLDIYFDGCDQFDKNLNALKSGSGIHTTEKLLASMAKEFILVGDESKYVEQLDVKFPVVLEVIPAALQYVHRTIQDLFPDTKIQLRYKNDAPVITRYGNQLLDVWFQEFPDLQNLNTQLKSITGVVEISLFYSLATKAIIAGNSGVRVIEKNK